MIALTSLLRPCALAHTSEGTCSQISVLSTICRSVRSGDYLQQAAPAAYGRRGALLGGLASLWLTGRSNCALAFLKSLSSEKPGTLLLRNDLDETVRVHWLNYDGDAEFFASLPPHAVFTVDTFEGHPWRITTAASGAIIQEFVASAGDQEVTISRSAAERLQQTLTSEQQQPGQPSTLSEAESTSFDGIGGSPGDYAPAQLDAVTISMEGGVASLSIEGFSETLLLYVGVAEAAALLYASGMESRRPSTINAWRNTLKVAGADVKRILVTRLVGNTYYARILLALPGGMQRSVDARPSDSLALALQCSAPVFVAKHVARLHAVAPLDKLLQQDDGRQAGPGVHTEDGRDSAGFDA